MFWKVGALGNLLLIAIVLGSAAIQLAIHHVPWTQALFQIGELSATDCAIAFVLGLVPVTVLELVKLARFGIDGNKPIPRTALGKAPLVARRGGPIEVRS